MKLRIGVLISVLILVAVFWALWARAQLVAQGDAVVRAYQDPALYSSLYRSENVTVASVIAGAGGIEDVVPPTFWFTVDVRASVNGRLIHRDDLTAGAHAHSSLFGGRGAFDFEPVIEDAAH